MADLPAALRERATRALGPIGSSVPPCAADAPCTICAGRGYYLADVPYGHPERGKLQQCPCRRQALAQAAQARQTALLAELHDELGELADCRLDTFHLDRALETSARTAVKQREALQKALSAAQRYANDPQGWMFITGPCGGGKSHLAAGVAHELAAHGYTVKYASVPLFLDFIKRGFRDDTADDRIAALQDVDVLIFDDLGAEARSKWNDETLFKIVHHRYLRSLMTIFTANVGIEEIERRVADRIEGRAQIVHLVVSSYRKEQRKQREARDRP